MDSSAKPTYLAFAALSFAAAVLSFVIYELTGTWPTEFGPWGGVLFVLVGITIVGNYVITHARVGRDATRSDPRDRPAENSRTND